MYTTTPSPEAAAILLHSGVGGALDVLVDEQFAAAGREIPADYLAARARTTAATAAQIGAARAAIETRGLVWADASE